MQLPACGEAAFSIAIRFASASIIRCRSADLVGVQTNIRTAALLNAASASNAAFGKQSAAKQSSLAPHDSKARLIPVTNRRRFMAKPCTPHLIPQAAQFFKIETANVGGRGALPSRSLGGSRGPFSHVREWPPYCALPHAAGGPKTQPLRVAPLPRPPGAQNRARALMLQARNHVPL